MKKIAAIILLLIISLPSVVSGKDASIGFDDYSYTIKVGKRMDLADIVQVYGYFGYDISYTFMVSDDTIATTDGDILITKKTGNTVLTAVFRLSLPGGEETEKYSTCNIRVVADNKLVRTADINLDGAVNAPDLSMVLSEYMGECEECDLDGNKKVDLADLSLILSRYGKRM